MKHLQAVIWILIALSVPAVNAQGPEFDTSQSKSLVVSISGELRGRPVIGAGIIVGVEDSLLYVATADHVVRSGTNEAENVVVELHFRSGSLAAELLREFDEEMDLAVLRVDLRGAGVPLERVSFGLLGAPDSLEPASGLYAVGHPEGERWSMNFDPHPFDRTDGHDLIFQTTAIAEGHSGGGLFDEGGRLVGMVKSRTTTQARATGITRVLSRFREWRYPVSLETGPASGWVEKEVERLVQAGLSALDRAIQQREWSDVPEPLARVYQSYFGDDFFRFFNYERIEHGIGDVKWHSARSTITGTVNATFYCRQSGRPRPVQYEGVPSTRWTWKVDGRTLQLSDVQPLDETP